MQTKNNALKEVALFFGLTLGLSYFVFWGPLALFQIPTISFVNATTGPVWAIALYITGGFVPSLAAVFLTLARNGLPGLKQLGRRVIQFKIGWGWYLAIVMTVVVATAGQLCLIRLSGQTFNMGLFTEQLGSALPLIVLGPLSEELGWRGYALDRLQARWNALTSAIMVGVFWGLWHLPLFYMVGTSQQVLGIPFVGFVCGITALSVLFTWLHNNTGGSIWTAIFFHWVYTYAAQVIASGVKRSTTYNWLEYLPFIVVAMIIVAIWTPRTLANKKALPNDSLRVMNEN